MHSSQRVQCAVHLSSRCLCVCGAGNFVAINFDRQRLGLMNEFKWSIDYSRSIGTDVRYILYLVGEYDGAKWLVDEMVG